MNEKPPIHILSLGAGVQSSTLALMAAHGEVPHLPHPTAAIFADTQNEPASVMRWLDQLIGFINAAPHPFPVHIVTKGKLSDAVIDMRVTKDGRNYSKSDIPFYTLDGEKDGRNVTHGKIKNRGCTVDYKIVPVMKKARELGAVPRKRKDGNRVHVVQWIGISLDEIYRMKPSRDWWSENVWPLVDMRMNRHDCKLWMESKGYPEPPRSSCVFCPYHNNHEWRRLRDEEPEEFAFAVKFEKQVQEIKARSTNFNSTPFLHASRVPLDQVDLSTLEDNGQMNLFNNECLGMCGV
jgi:hypothetical protein